MTKPFYILGVNQFEKDSAAALLRDGKLVAAADQERFSRVKHDGAFPADAIRFCLHSAHISLDDIDRVVGPLSRHSIARRLGVVLAPPSGVTDRHIVPRDNAVETHGMHHLGHASASYRQSGFEQSAVLTLDAMGNDDSVVGFYFEGRRVQRVADIPWRRLSLGRLYAAVTELLGFGEHGQGKVMGLAPYGQPFPNWTDLLEIDDFTHYHSRFLHDKQHPFWRMYRSPGGEITDEHKALAASVQKALETGVIRLVGDLLHTIGTGNLCLGGGVALNCSMNGALWAMPRVQRLYLHPNAADGGTAVGLALEAWADYGESMHAVRHGYWGPAFDDEYIGNELQALSGSFPVKFEKQDDIAATAAELLAGNAVTGWFQGRAEWGPRALGARSILADARNEDNWRRVNGLKGRESWRPLAPSVLEEHAADIFEHYTHSPYMLMAFRVAEDWRHRVPAIVHVDGTARPQGVTAEANPLYHAMLDRYRKRTGVPLVLNTSFNHAAEPMVATPAQAVHTALRMGLDALCIGSYLVTFPTALHDMKRREIRLVGDNDASYCANHSTTVALKPAGAGDVPVYIAAGATASDIGNVFDTVASPVLWNVEQCVAQHDGRDAIRATPVNVRLRNDIIADATWQRLKDVLARQALGEVSALTVEISGYRLVPRYPVPGAAEHPSVRMLYARLLPWLLGIEDILPRSSDVLVPDPSEVSCVPGFERMQLQYRSRQSGITIVLSANTSDEYRERMTIQGGNGVLTLDISGSGEGTLLLKRSGEAEGERLRLPARDSLEHDLYMLSRGKTPPGSVDATVAHRALRSLDAGIARWLEHALEAGNVRLNLMESVETKVREGNIPAAMKYQERSLALASVDTITAPATEELSDAHMPRLQADENAVMELFADMPRMLARSGIAGVAVFENVRLSEISAMKEELEQDGLFADAGHHYGLDAPTMRHSEGRAYTSLFIGRDAGQVQHAAGLDRRIRTTTDKALQRRWFGELLGMRGVPGCCAEQSLWAAFDANAGAWVKPVTAVHSPARGHWLLNTVLPQRYLDYPPHSFACKASYARARQIYELMRREAERRNLTEAFDRLNHMLQWPVVYFDFFRYVLLKPDISASSGDVLAYSRALPALRLHHASVKNPLWTRAAYRLFAQTIARAFDEGNRVARRDGAVIIYRDDRELHRLSTAGEILPLVLQWSDTI